MSSAFASSAGAFHYFCHFIDDLLGNSLVIDLLLHLGHLGLHLGNVVKLEPNRPGLLLVVFGSGNHFDHRRIRF